MKFLTVLALLGLCFGVSNYNHDYWDVQPKSYVVDYEAFRTSFFYTNDFRRYKTEFSWNVPLWVSYQIKAYPGRPARYPRPNSWFTDTNLVARHLATTEKPYFNSGYDRGHMCMKEAASRIGTNADRQTHTMLNALPQLHSFNAGIWLELEIKTMKWADKFGDVWVICGPVFSNALPNKFIGSKLSGAIAVPDMCYKIVIKTNGGLDVLAFMYPNTTNYKKPFIHTNYSVSISEIENMTGLSFMSTTTWNKQSNNTKLWD